LRLLKQQHKSQLSWLLGGVTLVLVVPQVVARIFKETDHRAVLAEVAPPSGAPAPTSRADDITVSSLLEELVDLNRLAQIPEPPYTTGLASSYDRRSRSASDPEGWFANDDWLSRDRLNYVREETNHGRREYVLLDVAGPGAIVRLWTATPTGVLRIYLDGKTRPALASDLRALLTGTSNFPPAIAYVAGRGYNSYYPIPFRTRCKVTVDDIVATDPFRGGPLEKFYYQINYRIYPPEVGERVRSYSSDELNWAAAALTRATQRFAGPASASSQHEAQLTQELIGTTDGAELTLDAPAGASIRELTLQLAKTDEASLAHTTLELAFDDEPKLELPLSEFFGGGPGLAPYESLPFSVRADGRFVSRWSMPFARRATLRVRGVSGVSGSVRWEAQPFTARSLYFRVQYRAPQELATRPFSDVTLLETQGQGLYVGNALAITNPHGARWWGEGDEKVYVDGETFPSWFGTGTEDYYGYAWSTPEVFVRPLHAQTRAEGPGFGGHFAMNRFHVLDAIPFRRALRFDLELWHWEETQMTLGAVAYFYSRSSSQ